MNKRREKKQQKRAKEQAKIEKKQLKLVAKRGKENQGPSTGRPQRSPRVDGSPWRGSLRASPWKSDLLFEPVDYTEEAQPCNTL